MTCPKCGDQMTPIYTYKEKGKTKTYYECLECGFGKTVEVET